MTAAVVAVDIGGTTVKASVVDSLGVRRYARVGPSAGGDDTVAVVLSLISSLRAAALADGLDVLAAGVVTPGLVDSDTGTVAYASNLGWRDFDLRSALAGRLGLPVSVGHDVRAAGRAERHLGAARGVDDFVLLQLGTGIAAAVVTGGTLVSGAGSAAGEAGHMPVYPDGEPCPCGKRGCLEAYAAGAAVPRRYRAALAAGGQAFAAALGAVNSAAGTTPSAADTAAGLTPGAAGSAGGSAAGMLPGAAASAAGVAGSAAGFTPGSAGSAGGTATGFTPGSAGSAGGTATGLTPGAAGSAGGTATGLTPGAAGITVGTAAGVEPRAAGSASGSASGGVPDAVGSATGVTPGATGPAGGSAAGIAPGAASPAGGAAVGASFGGSRGGVAGGGGVATAADVVELLGVDQVADRVWGEAVRALGFGVSTLTMLLDPALVVLGGGMAQAGEALLGPVARTLSELLVWREAPELRLSTLGPAAGQWGAAIEAFALTPAAGCDATWTLPATAIA